MTILDNQKANGARGEGVGPHRRRLATTLLERSGGAIPSFARFRPRGPPVAG